MSETVADLELDDEHVTIGLDDTLVEGCKRLVSIPSGILVVLDDEEQVKGVIGQRQMLKAIGNGVDVNATTCKEVMEMDVLKVDVIKSVNERMIRLQTSSNPLTPKQCFQQIHLSDAVQAVVAVDDSGAFEGYFSPDDYRQAQTMLSANPSLGSL